MKRIYNIFILIFGLVIVYFTYPYILTYISIMSIPQIDCVEWYKTHTGICNDFSDSFMFNNFILNIVLLIIPIVFTFLMITYIIPKDKSESNENI